MSTYSSCLAYDNIDCLLRIDDCIYLFAKAGDSDFQVTLNPNQAKLLGEALIRAAGKVEVSALGYGSRYFGDIKLEYEIAERKEDGGNEVFVGDDSEGFDGGNPSNSGEEVKVKIA